MSARRPPAMAHALLRRLGGRYSETLEGDLLEEFATGRSPLWFWHQVACALYERAWWVARQQAITFLAATLFFLLALSVLAPASYPVMGWARALESFENLALLVWLAGVPLILGGIAGTAERRRRTGAILLAAACVYLTPVTSPFTSAACDLCTRTPPESTPGAVLLLTPLCSALLAGAGAWMAGRITARRTEASCR